MAIGQNKRLSKGKKGGKKKIIDPLSRKEWFDFKAPNPFSARPFGKTLVTKTFGTKIATEVIKGRVVETALCDLKDKSDHLAWRKIKLVIDEVEGASAKTTFYGMDITRDKLCSMIRKWQTTIESQNDVKTNDGYILRVFTIAFTKRGNKQQRKTSYAQHSQIKEIRRKITNILTAEIAKVGVADLVQHLTTDTYSDLIAQTCYSIYPLQNVTIRQVKVLKRPKIDTTKLNELYSNQAAYNPDLKTKAEGGQLEDEAKNLLAAN